MDYRSLNEIQRKRMVQISNNDFEMEWENPDFFDTLVGKIPTIRHYQNEDDIRKELVSLEQLYSQFDFFKVDRIGFIKKIKNIVSDIQVKKENWYGLNPYDLEECIQQQEFCLISGEGGIGKSYFIKCLEEEFERKKIPHLCIYGKFEKDTHNIDIDEIIREAQTGFIFIVDAINEMSNKGQEELLSILNSIIQTINCRIIVTYRTNAIDNDILEKYKSLAKTQYSYPGVSFESALSELLKISVPDVYKYEDILYSNNALLLNMLCRALSDEKLLEETENSIASVTFILEHYIKKSIAKMFKGSISAKDPVEIWKDTKRVAKWMYEKGVKEIDSKSLSSIVKTGETFIKVMKQAGFLSGYDHDEEHFYFFEIDSLTDFLIARSLFEDIAGKNLEEQATIISQKVGDLYSLKEAIIIAIFDNMAPDYQYIIELLKKTKLIDSLQHETLIKINFKKDHIKEFLQVFEPVNKSKLLTVFGGYTDKPFNCTNYLNIYYRNTSNQLRELSLALSGTYMLSSVKGRLKNILYFLVVNNGKDRRVEEAFYYALWCCAAPNKDVRCLAMKILYEVVRQNMEFKNVLISEYKNILDPYIKESVIYVLANYLQDDSDIIIFFKEVVDNDSQLMAKSIKRISIYLKDKYGYIKWNRRNFYKFENGVDISEIMDNILFKMNLLNKNFLPFRYWGKDHIDMHTKFLSVEKQEVFHFNKFLEEKYNCVKNGECNGSMVFEKQMQANHGINFKDQVLDQNSFFCSYEKVLENIFTLFQESYNKNEDYMREEEFANSLFMKCIDIGTDIYYGSLMCNYYTNEFATYNNYQESIGYEVYDPIEYDEDVYIATPIPTYQGFVERLGDMILNRINIPVKKDEKWVKNPVITRENLLAFINPVEDKGTEWIMISGRISIHEDIKGESKWKDTYDIWCCTSEIETICDDGNARYLTIELDDYCGNLDDYKNCCLKPWLCKDVKNINYHSDIFDNTSLVLPPADLISYFSLRPIYSDVSWINKNGDVVIVCNNNKNSYYTDPIGGTAFMRKDYYDEYIKKHTLKYFAFTEKYIPETGYADETSLHFEIRNGTIIKEIRNDGGRRRSIEEINPLCSNCPHGYKEKDSDDDFEFEEYLNILLENKYVPSEDDDLAD